MPSDLIPDNECPELSGPTDSFGYTYAGPRCDGCADCIDYASLKSLLRKNLAYKACPFHAEEHQMFQCGGCKDPSPHWYCPEMMHISGLHAPPLNKVKLIEDDE